MLSAEEASNLTDISDVPQKGTRIASLCVEDAQMRENRWVAVDLLGKGGRIRTVATLVWVKNGINAWQAAARIEEGALLRSLNKEGKVGDSLSDWAIWSVVTESAKEIGIERFGAHDLRRTCAKLCRKAGGDLQQIKFLLGHSPSKPPNAISAPSRISPLRSMTAWGFRCGVAIGNTACAACSEPYSLLLECSLAPKMAELCQAILHCQPISHKNLRLGC